MGNMDYLENLKSEKFKKVNPCAYAKELKERFSHDKTLWYHAIAPKEIVEELYRKVNGDYSQLWHDHCDVCFCNVDKNTTENWFLSEDKLTWLCESCYDKLFRS